MVKSVFLPKAWPKVVRIALLQVVSLAQCAFAYSRSVAANSVLERVRLKAANQRLEQEVALLREELRIKDARWGSVAPHRRPQYGAAERMAILLLRAARHWSLAQTAAKFFLTDETIASWTKRVTEKESEAFIGTGTPVNKFPDFVQQTVRQLKTLCPFLGKAKIAEILARAGLHLGVSTVGRMLKRAPKPASTKSEPAVADSKTPLVSSKTKRVTSKRPNHVWLIDFTVVPIWSGFWVPWLPLSLRQCWPHCWWLAVCLDHHSRKSLGVKAFRKPLNTQELCQFLNGMIAAVGHKPKYIVCDQGPQFISQTFRRWAKRRSIRLRFGALGKHGSIALVERIHQTIKFEWIRNTLVPARLRDFQKLLEDSRHWYNAHRPHMALYGKTPNEVFYRRSPRNQQPRLEPRPDWPRRSGCARPFAKVAGKRGVRFKLHVRRHEQHPNLPIIQLHRAA